MALIGESRLVEIEREVDLFVARESARLMAARVGFDGFECANIETAVSELCANVLRHGIAGWAMLRVTTAGFEIEVVDRGPGFGQAPPRSDGLGIGLAGAKRLMDELTVENVAEGGRVVARKRLTERSDLHRSWWSAACASTTFGGEVTSGDAYMVEEGSGGLLVAVVDGLGHGEGAATAASTVIQTFQDHPDEELEELIRSADVSARSTRGAVALVARIDPNAGVLTYAGVGDVSGELTPARQRLVAQSGCLGVRVPAVERRELPWETGSALAMWTDGVSLGNERLTSDSVGGDLTQWVESRLRENLSGSDDALLLAIRAP